MLTKIFKFIFSIKGAREIEQLSKTDPEVRDALQKLHSAAFGIDAAIKKAKESNKKYQ